MKLTTSKLPRAPHGNVLIMTLVFSAIVALMVAGYLNLAKSRTLLRARSLAWNTAIPVLEAGIEEAFTHLKDDSPALTTNGWSAATVGGQPVLIKSRTFPDNSYFSVTIYNATANGATIYSSGFVPAPLGQGYISRVVRVTMAGTKGLFAKAILARSTINFAGDVQLNSYDSSNTNYSYPDGTYFSSRSSRFLANGWIASMASSDTAIDLAGAKIYGGIQYPGGATYHISTGSGGGGIVGDTTYVSNPANAATIQMGHSDNTLNINIPPTPLPTNSSGNTVDPSTWTYKAPLTTRFTTNWVTYAYVLTSGDWSTGSDTIHNQSILVQGNARLYVGRNGRVQMESGDAIKIPQGSSLQIYNDSTTDAVFTGIANDSQLPTKFYYWALSGTTGTKLSLTGGSYCAGAIYAYYQNVVLTGGSSGTRDFYGALVANTVVNSGRFWMSYDQALGGIGANQPIAYSYTEL
jgi:hypothetical protein